MSFKVKKNNNLKNVHELYKKSPNLFDMHYDVAYSGNYPNIVTVAGGKSTEWVNTSIFGQYFYFVWNVNALTASCVMGLVYSNDKNEILYRDGLVNSSVIPLTNTDYPAGGGNPYKINHTYNYVKFYVLNWSYTNRLAVYTTNISTFIPHIRYIGEMYQKINGTLVHTFSAGWDKSLTSNAGRVTTSTARAKNLKEYSIKGKTVQNGTPTPSVPLNIKGVGNSGLPNGYKKLQYLEADGAQAINIGLLLSGDNYKIETKYYMDLANKNANALFGAQYLNPLLAFYSDKIFCYGDSSQTATNRSHTGLAVNTITEVSATFNNGTVTVNIDGNTISYNAVTNFKAEHFQSYPMYLFTNNNGGTINSQNFKGKLYYWKISQGNTLLHNMVPAKRYSDDVLGMYDTVTNTFFTNVGTGLFTAGPEDISCEIPILSTGKNMIDIEESTMTASYTFKTLTTDEVAKYIGKTLTLSCYIDNIVSEIISCWCIYVITNQGNYIGNWVQQAGGRTLVTFTLPSNASNVRFVCNRGGSSVTSGHIFNVQLEESSTVTDYEPYVTPTINKLYLSSPLHGISTYLDELKKSTGKVTRKIGIKVLDGTEEWTKNSNAWMFVLNLLPTIYSSGILILSNQYQGNLSAGGAYDYGNFSTWIQSTSAYPRLYIRDERYMTLSGGMSEVSVWKQYLAQQYANGTPVIICYPLATPTEESISNLPVISTVKGTNVINTETEVTPTEFGITYVAKHNN